MPWHRTEDWDHDLLDTHRRLLGLHRSLPALRTSGLRWLDTGRHHMTFLRSLGEQVILVHLTDGPHGERVAELQDLDAAGLETVESAGGVWARFDDKVEVGADGPGHLVAVGTRHVV